MANFASNFSKLMFKKFLMLTLVVVFASCQSSTENKKGEAETAQPKKPTIVATTSMIGDAVKNVVGDKAEIISLMGAGVDPHLYKATQGDLKKLQDADIVFFNGLQLEGKMEDILKKLGKTKAVYQVTKNVPKEKLLTVDYEGQDVYDPHIWHDVEIWMMVVEEIRERISRDYPDLKETCDKNAFNYTSNLKGLQTKIKTDLLGIPDDQRIIITSHDAFNYFGKAFNIEVKGLQGISTVTEFGLKDIADLVDMITKRKIKSIFVESSVAAKPMEAIVKGCAQKNHEVKIGGSLYADALGEDGTIEGTYIGMMRHNILTITDALK